MNMSQKEYLETVRDCISLLMVLKSPPVDLAAASKAFAWVMTRNQVSADELQDASGIALETLKFFPAPSEILEIVKDQRKERQAMEAQMRLDCVAFGIDKNGAPWLASSEYVQDGQYIGPIPELGEPISPSLPRSEAPALEMRAEVKSVLEQTEKRMKSLPKRKPRRSIEPIPVEIDEAERRRQIEAVRREA